MVGITDINTANILHTTTYTLDIFVPYLKNDHHLIL